ncbi:response regulator [Arsenicitalea aurantiaca]|uniref:histidine kinase n=1 Tax=Arsenicitalea aurantiaca TaxID=1783274 RepID=A0A433X3G5_9HYPH|nr:CHASE3 domain-containing protein [Arsenicitalea aurantiaca]RUT28607.1 response regulator [Arsenicitalea aurantiaca]
MRVEDRGGIGSRIRFRSRITAAISIIALIGLAAISYTSITQMADRAELVRHTHEVMDDLVSLLSRVTDSETGNRGYVITGDASYLEPFLTAEAEARAIHDRLTALVADNPRQRERAANLLPLIDARFRESAAIVEARRAAGFEAAQALVATGAGKAAHDAIRLAIAEMLAEEEALLAQREAESQTSTRSTIIIIVIAFGLVGAAVVMLFRHELNRERIEQRAREQDERFQILARATTDTVWDYDVANDRLWWSESLWERFGYPASGERPELTSWLDWLHPQDRPRIEREFADFIAGTKSEWTGQYQLRRADGSYVHIVDRAFAMRDDNGNAVRVVGGMSDVTEARELENRLHQAQRLEAVGQLTGGVAHDFNNLLTVILGNAEMLVDSLSADQEQRLLAEMTRTAAERGAELTGRLLAFARRQALEPRVVNVNGLLSSMDPLLRRTLSEDIEIEFVRGAGLWETFVDAGQLEGAMLNLALNARDAMPGGGRLTIETANAHLDSTYADAHEDVSPGQYVMITVSDTGSGMDPFTLSQAFEPFFTTKDVGKGSGLGLSMVYGFIKQSNGHVKIYSEPGQGTAVRIYLPRAAAGDVDEAEKPRAIATTGGAEMILVVEDDELVRDYVQGQLRALGYRVHCVNDGPQALEALKQSAEFDLLFTDVVMPGGLNGRQLADAARALRPELPVLFTSGYTENAIVHHGRLDRGVQLLNKPYRRAELAAKIRQVLDGGRGS